MYTRLQKKRTEDMLNDMLFIDVETNGIGSFRPANQRIVQIAWIYNNQHKSYFIKDVDEVNPTVPHPYNVEYLKEHGTDFDRCVQDLLKDIKECALIVAHNQEFDIGCLKNELLIRGYDYDMYNTIDTRKKLCTMQSTIQFCKLPSKNPRFSSYKYPKLEELYTILFKKKPEIILHDALNDCIITKECVHSLLNNQVIKI